MFRLTSLVAVALIALPILGCGDGPTTNSGQPTGAPDHGNMVMPSVSASAVPFDAQFIDSMIVHHEGAVTMAKQAVVEATHGELREMASAIVGDQEKEIRQLREWRRAWYPNVPASQGMGMDMGTMSVSTNRTVPFDLRFIDAMIPHHQGAIAMAEQAKKSATHAELKTLADGIISAQQAEIAQMTAWKRLWYQQ